MTPATFYSKRGSRFGYSTEYGPNFHAGQDYPWRGGTAIPAFGDGRVVSKGYSSEAGHFVVLNIGGQLFLFYHLQRETHLAVGDIVKYGDTVGIVGATGNTTGDHLHLAASTSAIPGRGIRVDPVPLVAALIRTSLAGDSGTTINENEEEDDMAKNSGFYYDTKVGGKLTRTYLIVNAGSGFYHEYTNGVGKGALQESYNGPIAATFDTGSYASITESHANSIKAGLDRVIKK